MTDRHYPQHPGEVVLSGGTLARAARAARERDEALAERDRLRAVNAELVEALHRIHEIAQMERPGFADAIRRISKATLNEEPGE